MSFKDILKTISKSLDINVNFKSEEGKHNFGLNFREKNSNLSGEVGVEVEPETDPKIKFDLGVKEQKPEIPIESKDGIV